ncbi:MAG: hypothetical protein J6Q21_02790 [Alistipes sp.]|nr:hypothetical protein [Alistipes sp.]
MRLLRAILYCVVVLLAVGCESMFDAETPDPIYPAVKPTVPLKRRPIVPTTKLPRPRVAECYTFEDEPLLMSNDVAFDKEDCEFCEN